MIGTRIAHYEIIGKLGEGGMGVVYRARDTKLNRDVAIKVLAQALAGNRERMERFQREAQLLAQLNHPNISSIFGVEQADGDYALVMELVEGPTLDERLSAGPIPMEEALPIAKQIAEALEAAHEKGIIHRDLKPANIKVSEEGNVRVLDFGLAKALEGEPGTSTVAGNSPTLTPGATPAGVIMGTAAYMSPEQARGKMVDRRADIWSFGVVLYEMLTGRKLFDGETISDLLAGVLKAEIDLRALPDETPRLVRRLLKHCLERDRKQRLQAIGDARIEIEEVLSGAEEQVSVAATVPPAMSHWWGTVLAAVALVAGLTIGWVWRGGPPAESPYRRFAIATADVGITSISPDGKHVAYEILKPGQSVNLWLRDLESDTLREIAELPWQRYSSHAWSPESDAIVYNAGDELMKFSLTKGTTVRLCSLGAPQIHGAAWSPDGDVIVFSSGDDADGSLFEVPAHGGSPRPLFESDTSELPMGHYDPHFLPPRDGRRALLYAEGTIEGDYRIMLWDMAGQERIELVAGRRPVYSPTGHIVHERDRELWAAPFSIDSLAVMGDPFLVRQGANRPSVARDGTLVYRESAAGSQQLVWKSREGATLGTIGQPQELIGGPHISPDGKRVVVHAVDSGNMDIWIHDTMRSVKTRLTSNPTREDRAIWSPDGRHIVYSSDRNGDQDGFVRAADGSGEELALFGTPGNEYVLDWSPDGRYLVGSNWVSGQPKLFYVEAPLDREAGEPAPLLGTEFAADAPNFSPDGKYVAYASDETGREEVFVQRFPELGGKVQVSINGGTSPRWRADGNEIYFVRENSLVAVPVSMTPEFTVGNPEVLFAHVNIARAPGQQYDVSADGQRFVLVESVNQEEEATIRLVQNWFAEFRDRENR